jgi:hypothetical protein
MAFRAQIGSTLAAIQHIFLFFAYYDMILEIEILKQLLQSFKQSFLCLTHQRHY